ncbi:MAG TPA: hypothetical protein VEW46_17335 [Pyrinomonadaceae bacterium]|nr:hypothetical protein [Pyrinomonadaceae bacterium]
MDRVKTILGYEWRAYWRRFSRSGLRGGNQGIILILTVLIAIKYVQLLVTASKNVEKGNPKLLVQLLGAIFFVWLFPVASSARQTFASRKWLHLPLSLSERFIIRSVSLLLPPSAWLVILGSLAICYPLAHARNPFAGTVAGLLFIAIAWLTGLAISRLPGFVVWRKLLWIAALGVSTVAGLNVIRIGTANALLSLQFLPAKLVARVALGDAGAGELTQWTTPLVSLITLSVMAVVAGWAAWWSLKKGLEAELQTAHRKVLVVSARLLPGRLGGLVVKDFRYFRRLLDTYLGLAAAILGCVYLAVAYVPSAGVFWSFIVATFLGNAAVAFNSFGLDDRAGLDRYTLLPLSGEAILVSKNLAYLMIVLAEILPMLVIAGWRLGVVTSALGFVQAAALAGAYLTWGNWMSVTHPLKMQFFRFANSGAALVDAMGGILFGSLPGIVLIYLWQTRSAEAVAVTGLVLLLTGGFYFLSVRRFGNRLEQNKARIAAALS